MNLNHINNIIDEFFYNKIFFQDSYHPFGSIPRKDNSLRKILLIQVAKVVSPSILACSSNCWRNSSANLIWYCGDLFSFSGVDMVHTLMYSYLHGNYHNKKAHKKQTLKNAGTFLSVLTNNLIKDKTMANPNYTRFIYIFIGIRRTDLTNRIYKVRISAINELEARKQLVKEFVLIFAGRINPLHQQNFSKNYRTFNFQEVAYA